MTRLEASRNTRSCHSCSGEEWRYLAEGGVHVVFEFTGNETAYFYDKILRVPKKWLVIIATSYIPKEDSITKLDAQCSTPKLSAASSMDEPIISWRASLTCNDANDDFATCIVRPIIGSKYVDSPSQVSAPCYFWHDLYEQLLQDKAIPQSRLYRGEWTVSEKERLCVLQEQQRMVDAKADHLFTALLHTNYTRFRYRAIGSNDNGGVPQSVASKRPIVVCVEVKPKASYLAYSPLVHETRRAKFHRSRFELMQQLLGAEKVKKGWGSPTNNAMLDKASVGACARDENTLNKISSQYSPIDLFSGNKSRIQRAINSLLVTPQNNLRLFVDGTLVWGHDKRPSTRSEVDALITALDLSKPPRDGSMDSSSFDKAVLAEETLSNILSHILQRERLLEDLAKAQKGFDMIDADGAVAVYLRLVHLCGESHKSAEALIDYKSYNRYQAGGISRAKGISDEGVLLEQIQYPIRRPQCPALDSLLVETQNLARSLRSNNAKETQGGDETNKFLDIAHERASKCVHQLSRDACLYLLQSWLISTCLNDVSLMITFTCRPSRGQETSEAEGDCQACAFTEEPFDRVTVRSTDVQYRVKVVDLDAKPAKKLRSREEKERFFDFFHGQNLAR
jgi:hypothetical protein